MVFGSFEERRASGASQKTAKMKLILNGFIWHKSDAHVSGGSFEERRASGASQKTAKMKLVLNGFIWHKSDAHVSGGSFEERRVVMRLKRF